MNALPFLGYQFSPISPNDYLELSAFLKHHPQPLTGYTFATLAAWHPFFHYGWTFAGPETLLISCILDPDPHSHLLQPIGSFSPETAQTLLKSATELPYPLKIIGVCDQFLKDNPDFVRFFNVFEDRAVSNYVYSATALSQLPGRKYAKKRNLIAQAESLYSWSIQQLTAALTPSCFAVLDSILEESRVGAQLNSCQRRMFMNAVEIQIEVQRESLVLIQYSSFFVEPLLPGIFFRRCTTDVFEAT